MKKGYPMYVLFFLVLLAGLFFQANTAYAAKTADGYEYTADYYAGTCTITAYTGTDTEVVFPSKIDGCKVTAITGNGTRNVFTTQENNTVTSVVIPEGVKEIGPATFYCCYNLKSIKLPRTLEKIGSMAFRSAGIEEITIPGKVKYLSARY